MGFTRAARFEFLDFQIGRIGSARKLCHRDAPEFASGPEGVEALMGHGSPTRRGNDTVEVSTDALDNLIGVPLGQPEEFTTNASPPGALHLVEGRLLGRGPSSRGCHLRAPMMRA
jgi:hypothetical protein